MSCAKNSDPEPQERRALETWREVENALGVVEVHIKKQIACGKMLPAEWDLVRPTFEHARQLNNGGGE